MRNTIYLLLFCVPCLGIACGDEAINAADTVESAKAIASDADEVTEPVDEPAATSESEAVEWKPRHIVTLFRTPNGQPLQTKKTAKVPYYTLSYRDVNRGGRTERLEVRELAYRDEEVAIATAGTATLFCDDLVLRLGTGQAKSQYDFECTGRLQLHMDGMVIDCESGKLSNGKLQLENAEVTVRGTTFSSAQLAVEVDITGVKTAEFGMVPPQGFELMPPPLGSPLQRFPSFVPPPKFVPSTSAGTYELDAGDDGVFFAPDEPGDSREFEPMQRQKFDTDDSGDPE